MLLSLLLACTLCLPAYASVEGSDVVCGQTVDASGLSSEDCPDIDATQATVVTSTGEVLFARDAQSAVKIASITKVMTAIVALENASLDTTVTVDADAATVGESSAGLLEGDTMSLETALYALMVPSGNDAAIAIAKSVGEVMCGSADGAYDAFVAAMNAKAAELGCADTVYTNPHGLDFGDYEGEALHSTASDVAGVVSYAMKNDTFRTIVGGGSTTITVTSSDGSARNVDLESTDELLEVYEGMCGVKTGTTDYAGYCFAGAASRDVAELYTVVLGDDSSDGRFIDTETLLNWAYAHYAEKKLVNSTEYVEYNGSSVPVVAHVAHNGWCDASINATVADPDLAVTIFDLYGDVDQICDFATVEGDVHAGDVLGTITFYQAGETIATTDVIACDDQVAPNFFQGIGVAVDRFLRGMQGEPTVATTEFFNSVDAIYDK